MAKKIVGFIKLQVPAGKANPSPPIGPALGQRGLNIMEFCKAFNAQTQKVEPGLPMPVVITAYADKSFTFIMKTPPASVLIKKAAKIEKGSPKPAHRQGRQDHARAGRGDREGEDARPDRGRPGCRRCARSPAAPAAWASTWRACDMAHDFQAQEGGRAPRSTAARPIRSTTR